MQLIEENGAAVPAMAWRDVVNVWVDFSIFAGRTFYHCHISTTRTPGMIGVVEVPTADGQPG